MFMACSFVFSFLPLMIEIAATIIVALLIYSWANEPVIIESNDDNHAT